jgi:hypothetical protein
MGGLHLSKAFKASHGEIRGLCSNWWELKTSQPKVAGARTSLRIALLVHVTHEDTSS